jgi:hypothetical protein
MIFFEVLHLNEFLEEKTIGYFSSLEAAEKAAAQRATEPGFKDYPGRFLTVRREVPSGGAEGSQVLYEAYIYYHSSDFAYEFRHRIGFFTDLAEAEEAAAWAERHSQGELPGIEMEYLTWKCAMNLPRWEGGYERY